MAEVGGQCNVVGIGTGADGGGMSVGLKGLALMSRSVGSSYKELSSKQDVSLGLGSDSVSASEGSESESPSASSANPGLNLGLKL